MFCRECGAQMDEKGICHNCEASNLSDAGIVNSETIAAQAQIQNQAETRTQATGSGISENIAGLLCYLLGWLTGIVFLLVDKRPFVKFHALQSIIVFGALSILTILLGSIFALLPYSLWVILRHVNTLVSIGSLVLWVFLMIQAYHGKEYKLPIAGDIAQKNVKGNG